MLHCPVFLPVSTESSTRSIPARCVAPESIGPLRAPGRKKSLGASSAAPLSGSKAQGSVWGVYGPAVRTHLNGTKRGQRSRAYARDGVWSGPLEPNGQSHKKGSLKRGAGSAHNSSSVLSSGTLCLFQTVYCSRLRWCRKWPLQPHILAWTWIWKYLVKALYTDTVCVFHCCTVSGPLG